MVLTTMDQKMRILYKAMLSYYEIVQYLTPLFENSLRVGKRKSEPKLLHNKDITASKLQS